MAAFLAGIGSVFAECVELTGETMEIASNCLPVLWALGLCVFGVVLDHLRRTVTGR